MPDAGNPTAGSNPDALRLASEARDTAVWREWLGSMARDPEAALAFAIAYRDMNDTARDHWLGSLAADASSLDLPKIALFGPLLGVEENAERRARILAQIDDPEEESVPSAVHQAFAGTAPDETRIVVLVLPLYLDFVQLLCCGIRGGRFTHVRHDPIALSSRAPRERELIDGAKVERLPLKSALDEVASAILSQKRDGDELSPALHSLVSLLGDVGP